MKRTINNLLSKERYAYLAVILSILILYYKVIFAQLWMKWDMYSAIYPSFFSISEHLNNGMLPLWEFFVNRGVPLSHVLGIPIWSPLTLLLALIGFNQYSMQVYFIVIVLSAGLFMYLALKTHVNNHWLCALGAVGYATCGLFISNAEHATFISAAALYPLIYFSYRRLMVTLQIQFSILLGVSIGLLVLNSYPPFVVFVVFYLVLETVFSYKLILKNFKKIIIQLVIAILIAISSSFITLYTTFDIMDGITREQVAWDVATSSSLNFMNWFSALTPGLVQMAKTINTPLDISMDNTYLALPLLIPVFLFRKNDKKQLWMFFLIIFSVLLCMGKYGYLYKLFYEYVPGINTFKFPAGLRFFYFFFVLVASIRSLDRLIQYNEIESLKKPIKIFIGFFSVFIIFIILLQYMQGTSLLFPKYILLELFISIFLLWIFFKISDLKLDAQKYIFVLFIISFLFSGLAIERNDKHTIGTMERPYSFSDEIKKNYIMDGYTMNSFAHDSAEMSNDAIFRRVFQNQGYIGSFQLKSFQLAKDSMRLAHEGDPVVWFTKKTVNEINEKPNMELEPYPQMVKVQGNRISFELNNEGEGYIILNQTYFPGWQAKVNDENKEIIELEDGTMAIRKDSVNSINNVVFEFKPIRVIIAFWITLFTWISIIFYFIYKKIMKNTKKQDY